MMLDGALAQLESAGDLDESARTDSVQALLPDFEIGGRLGSGGMGAVFRAVERASGRRVAIKVMHAELGADPVFGERFEREAALQGEIDHPGIVAVFGSGVSSGRPYLITELVEGTDLRTLMAERSLGVGEALRLVIGVAEAVSAAHGRGLLHRDIKPENILIDQDGSVKIADFGLARSLELSPQRPTLTAIGQAVGTPHYISPEQLAGDRVGAGADVYAVGVVLYELLTGRLPVGHFGVPSEVAGADRQLDGVVLRALAHDPERRYPSMAAFAADLDACRHSIDTRTPAFEPRRAVRRLAADGAALAILLGLVVWNVLAAGQESAAGDAMKLEFLALLRWACVVAQALVLAHAGSWLWRSARSRGMHRAFGRGLLELFVPAAAALLAGTAMLALAGRLDPIGAVVGALSWLVIASIAGVFWWRVRRPIRPHAAL